MGECPIEHPKEIEDRKGRLSIGMEGTVALLMNAKTIVGTDKDGKNRA